MPILISGTPTNLEELRAIGEKAIAEGKEVVNNQNKVANTLEEPKEVSHEEVTEEPTIEEPEEAKTFTFYDADIKKWFTITEGIPCELHTEIYKISGTWRISYIPPIASFSLDYGYWSAWYNSSPIKMPKIDNRQFTIKPNSIISSESVKSGVVKEVAPPSLIPAVSEMPSGLAPFGGSKTITYVAIGLLAGLVLMAVLRT